MITKTILSVSLAVLSLGAVVPAASAQSLTVQIAPPAPRYEVVPAPRRGMVWTPGHWEWRQKRHVWVPGVWMKARPGYVYTQPTWQERNGRWDWRGVVNGGATMPATRMAAAMTGTTAKAAATTGTVMGCPTAMTTSPATPTAGKQAQSAVVNTVNTPV